MKFNHSLLARPRVGTAAYFLFVYPFSLTLAAENFNLKGHLKYQSLLTDNQSPEHIIDSRLNLSYRQSNWALHSDYQLFRSSRNINDNNRLLDLTTEIHKGDENTIAHRLDRLHLTYNSEQVVFRLGRQAISWGNGLVYNPMDFFNPFDPVAIDREYKTGDDMLYSQISFDNDDDLQAVWVGRRDSDGSRTSDVSSIATKYHVFLDDYEIDFLLAEHFDQQIIGFGGVANIGGSVWRSDVLSTEINSGWQTSAVLNASYSWIAFGKNMSGHLEFFGNGFGIENGDYSIANLTQNAELTNRVSRGELFTLGKHYLAASATIELTPLWLLMTTLFNNLDDESKLLQLLSQHDLEQNLQLLIALNIPAGDEGTEFGGINSDMDESLFLQLAFYF